MASLKIHWIFVCLVIINKFTNTVLGQGFSFQEKPEDDPGRQNANQRVPLYSPGSCGENELLYPGDQADDWICDCSPGHLYYPGDGKCYPAYQQGPCSNSTYLVLTKGDVVPQCVRNPCLRKRVVLFRRRCYELQKPGPCANPQLSYVVGVNETTLEIDCIKLSMIVTSRIEPEVPLPDTPKCPPGCKRFLNNTCPENTT